MLIIRLDPEEVNQRVEFSNIVHHWGPSEAPPVSAFERTSCSSCDCDFVLDALSFVKNHTVEEAFRSKQWK